MNVPETLISCSLEASGRKCAARHRPGRDNSASRPRYNIPTPWNPELRNSKTSVEIAQNSFVFNLLLLTF
jgi:hypothetical protein